MGSEVKLSICIPVYQSHEALRRQVLHWQRLDLPDDVEIIIADDGSDPPLEADGVQIVRTDSELAWTDGLARNAAAVQARGDYLLMLDIDYIISREVVDAVRQFEGDRMGFPRYFGVLLEDGTFTQDLDTLIDYGFNVKRLNRRGLYASVNSNTFAIKRGTFEHLGGYDPKHCTKGYHAGPRQSSSCYFNGRWNRWAKRRGIRQVLGPDVYMFPIGRYHKDGDTNPMGLFHDLSYERKRMWKHG